MSRSLLLAVALLAIPLSGCLGGAGFGIGLFADWRLPGGSPEPVPVRDCAELLGILNDRALAESDALLDLAENGLRHGGWFGGWRGGDTVDSAVAMEASDDAGSPAPSAPSAAGAEFTGTNNQEADVDEADIIKTDGEWTYVLQGGFLYILTSPTIGSVTEHARIAVASAHAHGVLLLDRGDPSDPFDDHLILITYESGWSYRLENAHRDETRIRVLDLGDRSDPRVVKDLRVGGHSVGARLVDGHAYVVVHSYRQLPLDVQVHPAMEDLDVRGLTWDDYWSMKEPARERLRTELAGEAREFNRGLLATAKLTDHLPRVLEQGDDGILFPRPIDDEACSRVLVTKDATGRSVSTILAVSLADDDLPDRITQTLGSQPILYASLDALVLAAPSRDAWWFWDHPRVDEATDLQWFDLDGLDVVPRASGRVPGIVQDSFGISEHAGVLRVATTTGQWGRWWMEDAEPMMNHLVILEAGTGGALVPTGMVGGIAPGERIWSARFTQTRAYIITFEEIDPLWIIDITDKKRPKILGELEIPGVSTYIHPLSDELLLTIGYGPRENGLGLDWSRIQVSLFDISDESDPVRADVLDIAPRGGWSWSGAVNEHKAFTYWDRIGVLAVPMSTSNYAGGDYRQEVALRLIDVDVERKTLSIHGDASHKSLLDGEPGGYAPAVQRSHFLGLPDEGVVSVYSMSALGVVVHDLATLVEQDHVHFAPGGWRHSRMLID